MAFVDERFLGPLADPPAAPPAVSPSAGQSADRIARVREIMHQGVTNHQGFNKSGKYKLHRAVDAVIDGVQEWEQTRGLSFDEAISNPDIKDEMARFVLERADDVQKLDLDEDINTRWFEQQGFKREDLNALKKGAEQERERIIGGGSFAEGREAIHQQVNEVRERQFQKMSEYLNAHHEMLGEDYSSKMHDIQNIPNMSDEEKRSIATEFAEKQEQWREREFEREFGVSMDEMGFREHVNMTIQDPRTMPEELLNGYEGDVDPSEIDYDPEPTEVLNREKSVSAALTEHEGPGY